MSEEKEEEIVGEENQAEPEDDMFFGEEDKPGEDLADAEDLLSDEQITETDSGEEQKEEGVGDEEVKDLLDDDEDIPSESEAVEETAEVAEAGSEDTDESEDSFAEEEEPEEATVEDSSSDETEELPPLEDLMSESEMAVTGVDRLTADEKQALREWLEVFVDQDAKFAARKYAEQRKAEARAKKVQAEPEQKPGGISPSGTAETTQGQDVVREEPRNRFNKNVARMVGDFSGWNGKTVFRLDNGEVWQQRRPDSVRRTKTISNPEVKISKNFMGVYVMEIPAAKVKVPVTRIK